MQDPSGDELLTKLATLLHQHERNIKKGESKLCLTGNSVVFLNKCFVQLHSDPRKSTTERVYQKSSQSCVNYLDVLTKEAISLKIVPGPSPRLDVLLNISHFKSIQFLEIKKIPLGYITGLQSLRQQLKGLTCFRSVFALSEVFICCGGDLSSTPFAWERLEEVNLSYNSINSIDDSLKVLPALKLLNLSHNSIESPENDDSWKFLSDLKCINIGYNQLNKVPCASSFNITPSLKVLILRNNDIQNLKGIQHFTLLETLDVSNNCIASFQELVPLAHLEKLTSLQLTGNPVCYCDDYRMRTVSYMSPYPRRGEVFLDNELLSPLEQTFVGCSVDPVSPLTYLSTNVTMNEEVFTESTQDMTDNQPLATAVTKKKKGKKVKARNVSILTDVEDESAFSSSVVSSQGEQSLEHSQDIERLEKARDLGGEHWLPAINHVLHGQTTEQQPAKEEKMESSISTSPYFIHQEEVVVDVNFPPPIQRKSSTTSQHSDYQDQGLHQPFIVTLKTMNTADDNHEDDKDLLVTVTDHFIRERDCGNGNVICKLETDSLISAKIEESEDGDFYVHLKFDYLNRDLKERYYIMDDRDCEQFLQLLHPALESNEEAKNTSVTEHLQCLKCSAYFTEDVSKTSHHICPDCGSTKIIEIHSPEMPINTRSNNDGAKEDQEDQSPTCSQTDSDWLGQPQKMMPDLMSNSSPMNALISHPDIYNTSTENGYKEKQSENELEMFKVTEKSLDDSNNSQSVDEPDSLETETENKTSYFLNSSSGFIINNDVGFTVNKQYETKSLSPLRTSVLSNSLKNPEQLNNSVEARQKTPKAKSIPPQKRVIDSPISLKTSSRNATADEVDGTPSSLENQSNSLRKTSKNQPNVSSSPSSTPSKKIEVEKQSSSQRKTSGNQQNHTSSPSSSSVIRNLLSKFGSKMSGSGLPDGQGRDSAIDKTPKIESKLVYDISPDEFKDCDHRLKLYFEVSLFTGGQEESLYCLIKAPVVVYGEQVESTALLVVSNLAIYILRFEETAGLSAKECLSLIGSYSLKDIQFVDFGLSFHSFRLELNGDSPGSFTFLVRDTERCKEFSHLFLKYLNQYKSDNGEVALVTTDKNLQTLANIRLHVLGIHQEDLTAMGERYLEQLTLFTDPPLIKDRKSLLRHYSQCFIGKDFVDWMIQHGEANTRTEAVEKAQTLVGAGLIEHVYKECKFEDKEQFYKFGLGHNSENSSNEKDEDGQASCYQNDVCDTDPHINVAVMAFKVLEHTGKTMDVKPVTMIVTRTHVAVTRENHQWPLPRYLDVPTPKEPQFHCIEKYKMTDISGLEFFEDSLCHIGISISEEDAPLECADSYLLIKTETAASIDALVNGIKTPWEKLFGVELQTSSTPFLEK